MVAAEREHGGTVGAQVGDGGLNRRESFLDVEGVDADVTEIGYLLVGKGGDLERRVVRTQQLRRSADVARTEPSAGAVADTRIEGNAEDRHVGARDLVQARETRKGGRLGVAGDARGVDGSDERSGVVGSHVQRSLLSIRRTPGALQ